MPWGQTDVEVQTRKPFLFCFVFSSPYGYLSAPRFIRKHGQGIRPIQVQPKANT